MNRIATRLFEVHLLENDGIAFYIKGRATINDDTALFQLQIDEQTYQQLNQCISFDNRSRYRLSLQSNWDPSLQRHIGKITRFCGEQSEDFYFSFSEDFGATLAQLGKAEAIEPLNLVDKLTFVRDARDLSAKDIQKPSGSLREFFSSKKKTLVYHALAWPAVSSLLFLSVAYAGNQSALQINNADTPIIAEAAADDMLLSAQALEEVTANDEVAANQEVALDNVNVTSLKIENLAERGIPEGFVALTFDDGPGNFTAKIIDILTEHQVAATFFFIGENALEYPDAVKYAAMKKMSVQNHSWSHPRMARLTLPEQLEEIFKTNELLTSLTDEPVTLFRPPYGSRTQQLIEELPKHQMRMMLWNRDPEDWKAKNSQDIVRYFFKTNPSGGVYLLHENRLVVEALPEIIHYLKQLDVEFAVLR